MDPDPEPAGPLSGISIIKKFISNTVFRPGAGGMSPFA